MTLDPAANLPEPDRTPIGHPGGLEPSWHHTEGHGYIARGAYETTRDLLFPESAAVYYGMATDAKVGGLLRAIVQTVAAATRTLDTDGVDPDVARWVEVELGLDGDTAAGGGRRRAGLFNLGEHVRHALRTALIYGFAPGEPVYETGPAFDGQPDPDGVPGNVAHLRTIIPLHPRNIVEVRVTRLGDLDGLILAGIGWDTAHASIAVDPGMIATRTGAGMPAGGAGGADDATETFIPADRLLHYALDRDGADWTGTSLLRTAYKHYLLKEDLLRLDALAVERTGMGLPVVYYSEDGNKQTALDVATQARTGAYAGVALRDGHYKLELQGVSGTVKDPLPSIEYHDRMIGESALATFLELGHSGGLGGNSTALAETLLAQFNTSLNATCSWLLDTFTDTIIRDLVALNFGPGTAYPRLRADTIEAERVADAATLKTLADAGLLDGDETLKADLRRRYRLPEPDPIPEPAPAPPQLLPGTTPDQPELIVDPNPVPADPAVLEPLLARIAAATDRLAELAP